AAERRATTAPLPARSWSRVMTDRPSLTDTSATVQPGSRVCTQGTIEADGTDWASSHSGSSCAQSRLWIVSGVLTATRLSKTAVGFMATRTNSPTIAAHSPTRRALHRWIGIVWGGLGRSLATPGYGSRLSARSMWRSWDGRASPHARPGGGL